MRDALGPGTTLGYCTNVHAGVTWDETKRNLQEHALAVKQRVCPDEPMGVGLWLAAPAARELLEHDRVGELGDFLGEHGLLAYTFNGFPYGDFHQEVVKHRVYEPDWSEPARVAYTRDLIAILARLVAGGEGSISTLPVGWKTIDAARVDRAAIHLREIAEHLRRLEQDTGTLIHVDLEPEPGCHLQRSDDVVRLFTERLDGAGHHLRVCHDICHAAVMFEDQAEIVARYDAAGIAIGKVQVSAGLCIDFDALTPDQRQAAAGELAQFREPRYLHQTVLRRNGSTAFYEDLPEALAVTPSGEWRVHFHVPIYLDRIGGLGTTRSHIRECLDLLGDRGISHWEVETYAWDVLPAPLRRGALAEGIAEELSWLRKVAGSPVT